MSRKPSCADSRTRAVKAAKCWGHLFSSNSSPLLFSKGPGGSLQHTNQRPKSFVQPRACLT